MDSIRVSEALDPRSIRGEATQAAPSKFLGKCGFYISVKVARCCK
jgi:hypothetical protein